MSRTKFVPEKHLPEMGWDYCVKRTAYTFWENERYGSKGRVANLKKNPGIFTIDRNFKEIYKGRITTIEFATELFRNLGLIGREEPTENRTHRNDGTIIGGKYDGKKDHDVAGWKPEK